MAQAFGPRRPRKQAKGTKGEGVPFLSRTGWQAVGRGAGVRVWRCGSSIPQNLVIHNPGKNIGMDFVKKGRGWGLPGRVVALFGFVGRGRDLDQRAREVGDYP